VADTLRLLRNEVEMADIGNQIVVRHLLSTLFVYVLREWADAASPLAGNWFSALRSPHIARTLACIHEAPATIGHSMRSPKRPACPGRPLQRSFVLRSGSLPIAI
jgi:hypothetical protein